MAKKRRVPKTREQRVRDCETHLYFLWDAHRLYLQEQERFKQIAAELRVLVCKTRTNRPLLLMLMDEYGFSCEIHPPVEPPFDKQPIPTVGWQDDPIEEQFRTELQAALGNEEQLEKLIEKRASMRRAVSFSEFVNRGLAVYVAPYDYSYKDLTLAVAQQLGSGHEDDTVEEPIARLQNIVIGGHQSHVAPLIGFAKIVIGVGTMFLTFLAQNGIYQPKHFKLDMKSSISSIGKIHLVPGIRGLGRRTAPE